MDATRERIDLTRIGRLYGPVREVSVRELFYEARPGYSGPEGWCKPFQPISLADAADTIATRYNLAVTTEGGRVVFPDFLRSEVVRPRFRLDRPRTYLRGRLSLRFLDDPDTPVIVTYRFGNRRSDTATATYHCAIGEAAVDGFELGPEAMIWLESFEDEAETWYEAKRGN